MSIKINELPNEPNIRGPYENERQARADAAGIYAGCDRSHRRGVARRLGTREPRCDRRDSQPRIRFRAEHDRHHGGNAGQVLLGRATRERPRPPLTSARTANTAGSKGDIRLGASTGEAASSSAGRCCFAAGGGSIATHPVQCSGRMTRYAARKHRPSGNNRSGRASRNRRVNPGGQTQHQR